VSSDSPAPGTPDLDGLAPLPPPTSTVTNPSTTLDALKRIPTTRSATGGVPASDLTRVRTVELEGKVYPTRLGRGEEIGEPLRDAVTREEVTYIEWPEGDPEVSTARPLAGAECRGGARVTRSAPSEGRRSELTTVASLPCLCPQNPFNYSQRRKWLYTIICVSMTALTSTNATAYSGGFASAGKILGVSKFDWTVGNAVVSIVACLFLSRLAVVPGRV
jgi:hypothetical protein